MTILVVHYFCATLIYIVVIVLMMQILPNRLNAWKVVGASLLFASHVIPKFLSGFDERLYFPINMVQLAVVLVVMPLCLFRGPVIKRIGAAFFFMAIAGLSEASGVALYSMVFGSERKLMMSITGSIASNALVIFFIVLLGSMSVMTWRMIEARKFQPVFLLFFVLPIAHLITTYSYAFAVSTDDGYVFSPYSVLWAVGLLLSLGADMVMLVYVLSQEKKAALEEALLESEHQMQLEQAHYREIEQRREAFARIRHDINNQLASVAHLIRSGATDSALMLVDSLVEGIHDTKENAYCDIPVVNAILTQKVQTCENGDIGINIELDMPCGIDIEPMHLCSVFSNLLDNAIAACDGQVDSVIRLSSKVDGDYLFIKVVNPSEKPPTAPAPGRGYGTRILTELASRYGGDYNANYADGIYTAVIFMLAIGER